MPTPTAPTAHPLSDTLHALGDTADAGTYTLTAERVQECKPHPYIKPTQGSVWLGVEVTVAATGDQKIFPLGL